MRSTTQRQTPTITPELLSILEWLSGTGWILRDDAFVAVWCNDAYARFNGLKPADIVGTRLRDFISEEAAQDREASYTIAIEERRPVTNIQFNGDSRTLSIVFPIDKESFGHSGVLCMIQEAPRVIDHDLDIIDTIIKSPVLNRLVSLSIAELRILYYLAGGNSTTQISKTLSRSAKTIENQIASIHKKVGTTTRGELVQFVCGRGIEKYTPDEWEAIINSERAQFEIRSPETSRSD
jgi:DNA-binding CsgD family transcriptional regulator